MGLVYVDGRYYELQVTKFNPKRAVSRATEKRQATIALRRLELCRDVNL